MLGTLVHECRVKIELNAYKYWLELIASVDAQNNHTVDSFITVQ